LLAAVAFAGCASDSTNDDDDNAADAAATDTTIDNTDTGSSGSDAGSTVNDSGSSGPVDAGTTPPLDAGSTGPTDAGATKPVVVKQTKATVPMGETIFLDGDDYLWSFGAPDATKAKITIEAKPKDATAQVVGGDGTSTLGRLTPDKPGKWVVCKTEPAKDPKDPTKKGDPAKKGELVKNCIDVSVVTDFLNEDTFVNYNYSPTSPIAADPGNKPSAKSAWLWVTATTSNGVQRVKLSADDTKPVAEEFVPTGSWPTAVTPTPDGKSLLVAQCGRDSLGLLDLAAKPPRLVDAIRVGNEPAHVIAHKAADGDFAYVALSGEDAVAKVDLKLKKVVGKVTVGRDPRAMAFDKAKGRLYVASLLSSNEHPRGLLQKKEKVPEPMQRDIAVIDVKEWKVLGYARNVGTIIRGLYLRPDAGGLLAAHTHAANHQAKIDANSKPHQHRMAVIDAAKAEKSQPAVIKSIELDKLHKFTGPAPSPYTMMLSENGHYLVTTLSAGKAIMFLDAKTYAELGRIPVEHDPRGLYEFGGRTWTYAWLSNVLQGVESPGKPILVTPGLGGGKNAKKIPWIPKATKKPVSLVIGADPTPKDVKEGQRIFNDAAFSKHGDFSCNNCHLDGITDGLVWDLLVDGSVNTLAFRNVGGTGPFLWGGQLPTLFDFSREVLKLVGAAATGKEMELLTTYMQSVTAPPNPYSLPGGRMTDAAKAGAKIFYGSSSFGGASCAECHSGPLYTNTNTVDGKTAGKKTDVPSLLGVYDTGPWGREGQWTTLKAMVDYGAKFTGAKLSDKARADLLAFVQQLPGDRLYITSATPLDKADHVWFDTKVQVSFSGLLNPGQEGLLLFREVPKSGAPKAVPGTWKVSGRYARFAVGVKLKQYTSYEIAIGATLVGQLGEKLGGAQKIRFSTGGTPKFDVSGKWKAILKQAAIGTQTAEIAFLQAKGGKVTGALLTKFQQGDIDKGSVDGHVSGEKLILAPFYLDTTFGKFFIEKGITSTCTDGNNDKFADNCKGSFPFKFGGTNFQVAVEFKRLELPKTTSANTP